MDFIKLHKAFEVLSESKSLESGVQLLWYKLVAIANAAYWPEDLSPANITLMSKTKMSEKTLINNRNKLVQYGLIEYKSRGTQKAGIYKIIDITESELTGNITVNREANRKQTGSKPAVNEGVNRSTYINKTKQDNINNYRPPALAKNQMEADFEKLWALYPRKERKEDALKAYKKAIKAGTTNKEIQTGIVAYEKSVEGREKQYIAQGGTWFHQQRWKDELTTETVRPLTTQYNLAEVDKAYEQ